MSGFQIEEAKREQAKIKIGLQGPAGSGKTYSALTLAMGLTNNDLSKVVVIDTENRSASLYAKRFQGFRTIKFAPPYGPERCIEAIDACVRDDVEVIIFDSISHEWMGTGGILDLHGNMSGADMMKWAKLTPRHNKFIQHILQVDKHMICTMRSKQDYVMEENSKGRMVPRKVGLKAVARDGVDFEFTVHFEIDIKNFAEASKDRTELFKNKPEFVITEETGKQILDWCHEGVEATPLPKPIPSLADEMAKAIKLMEDAESLEDLKRIWDVNKMFHENDNFRQAKDDHKIRIQEWIGND